MSFNSIRFKAYGAYAANAFDDHSAVITTPAEIPTKPPIPVFNLESGIFFNIRDDTHNPRPHLPDGCEFVKKDTYKYSQDGKSATGSTCEIAKINWNIKYNIAKDKPRPHRIGQCVQDGNQFIFKGLIRCSNSRKRGCSREVIGRTCSEAVANFCKLYGADGRCDGDPAFTPQSPRSFDGDSDRNLVVKIIDDDLPNAMPVAIDFQQQQTASIGTVNINPPPSPTTDPTKPPAPAAGMDFSSIFSGTTAGISNTLLIGGGAALLILLMVIGRK